MSANKDFSKGDYVAHIILGDGVVESADDGVVVVRYADKHRTVGRYDKRWFEMHLAYLFHRTARGAP